MIRQVLLMLGVAVVTAGPAAAAPAWTLGPGFDVIVSVSPKAAARLVQPKETIKVWAEVFGDANAEGRHLENDGGQIELGPDRTIEMPGAGVAHFPGPKYDKKLLVDIDGGQPQVLVNVFSGRHSSPDNLLDCDFFQDAMTVAAGAPIQIHCKLIGE
jgi:hypothetical protein